MTDKNKSLAALLLDGVWGENPLFRLALGLCPAVAITVTGFGGLAIGAATGAALVCMELLMSILGRLLVDKARIPTALVLAAALGAVAQMALAANWPALASELGLFLPLTAASTLLLLRGDAFSAEVSPASALADGIGMGLGYLCAMTVLGAVREVFAYGTMFGQNVLGTAYDGNALALLPAGGFLLLGLLMGVFNAAAGRRAKGKEDTNA